MNRKLIAADIVRFRSILTDEQSQNVYQRIILGGNQTIAIPMKNALWNWKTGQIILSEKRELHTELLFRRVFSMDNDDGWYGFSFYSGLEEGFLPHEVIVVYGSSVGYTIPDWIMPAFEQALDNLFADSTYRVKIIIENQNISDSYPGY
jgi:hypothetical protein